MGEARERAEMGLPRDGARDPLPSELPMDQSTGLLGLPLANGEVVAMLAWDDRGEGLNSTALALRVFGLRIGDGEAPDDGGEGMATAACKRPGDVCVDDDEKEVRSASDPGR